MNLMDLETLLRKAPRPKAPPGLLQKLQEQVAFPPDRLEMPVPVASSFWRRWLPALSFSLFWLASLVVIAIQTRELLDLRGENANYRSMGHTLESLRAAHAELLQWRLLQEQWEQTQKDHEELKRLQAEAARLRDELKEQPKTYQENEQLRMLTASVAGPRSESTLANHPRRGVLNNCADCHYAHKPGAAQEGQGTVLDEKEAITSHTCAGFLKYISIVARAWAKTNANAMPRDFLSFSNELGTPRILICPLDREKIKNSTTTLPATWDQWQPAITAYELLSPGIDLANRTAPYIRCRNHGHVGRVDGTVLRSDSPTQHK